MANLAGSFEVAYPDLLAGLWEEFEDLLESHYGLQPVSPDGLDRLRLKLSEMRQRLVQAMDQAALRITAGGADDQQAFALRRLAADLLWLLDAERLEEDFDLACGATIVVAQHRILDEAQRLAPGPVNTHCHGLRAFQSPAARRKAQPICRYWQAL